MSDTAKASLQFLPPDACLFDNDKQAVSIISSLFTEIKASFLVCYSCFARMAWVRASNVTASSSRPVLRSRAA